MLETVTVAKYKMLKGNISANNKQINDYKKQTLMLKIFINQC